MHKYKEITVEGKKFIIKKVNNFFTDGMYERYKMMTENSSLTLKIREAMDGMKKYEGKKDEDIDKEDLLNINKEIRNLFDTIDEKQIILKKLNVDLVKSVLELNGYEYDEDFWYKKTDKSCLNNFLDTVNSLDRIQQGEPYGLSVRTVPENKKKAPK